MPLRPGGVSSKVGTACHQPWNVFRIYPHHVRRGGLTSKSPLVKFHDGPE